MHMLNGYDLTELKRSHMAVLRAAFNQQYAQACGKAEAFEVEKARFDMTIALGLQRITVLDTGPAKETLFTDASFQFSGADKMVSLQISTSLSDPSGCSVKSSVEDVPPRPSTFFCADTRVIRLAPQFH